MLGRPGKTRPLAILAFGPPLLMALLVSGGLHAPAKAAGDIAPSKASDTAPSKVWGLVTDFAKHPTLNPMPDTYGDPGVWSWMYGTAGTASSYTLDTPVLPQPGTFCGGKDQYWWQDHGINPLVDYNAGPTFANSCAAGETWDHHSVFVAPGTSIEGTEGVDSIIGWTSPVSGTIRLSGTLQGINSSETGVTWELLNGATAITGPNPETGDQVAGLGPKTVTVTKGQSLYLAIGDGTSNGTSDDLKLTLDIVQPASAGLSR
jgi:hypothetical protein